MNNQTPSIPFDAEEVVRTLRFFVEPDEVTEIRVLNAVTKSRPHPHTVTGYFDGKHFDAVPAELMTIQKASGFYFIPSAVNPELLPRSSNRFRAADRGGTTSDGDVPRRFWLLVDLDPVRPSGISSSNAEHAAARDKAVAIRTFLKEQGWPDPVLADSGNGFHLVYGLSLPAQDDGLVERVLKALARRFDDDRVKVDTTTHNPARIWKLYGTVSCKGDDTPDRPHRQSRMIDVPQFKEFVPKDKLEELVAAYPEREQPREPPQARRRGAPAFDLDAWIDANALTDKYGLGKPVPWRTNDGREAQKRVFKVCPWNAAHTNGSAFLIHFGDGAISAGCHHNGCSGKDWHALRDVIEPGWRHAGHDVPYVADENGLTYLKPTQNGTIPIRLTNFRATIAAEVVRDDGAEVTRCFEIEAALDKRNVVFAVTAGQFSSMNWVAEHLGARALVFPGQATKDHARAAIQMLSGLPRQQHIYAHTGWRKLDGGWVYLHNGGALGTDGPVIGVQVDLNPPLDLFQLPNPPAGDALKDSVRAVLDLCHVAPDTVMVPVQAAVFRSVLGPADFSVHLAGPSGAGKSEIAALAQQHFGVEYVAKRLPGAWASTANANELLTFSAKDTLLVIDDFAPAGGQQDVQKMHRDADRLFRAQGNRSGRQRARPDGSLRPVKGPRGLVLSTGEDIPRTFSVRARISIVEVAPDDVDWTALTGFQQQAADGVFAAAMSGYIKWLAGQYDEVKRAMPGEIRTLRERASGSGQHRRTPDIVANLAYGFNTFLAFAVDIGAIGAGERDELQARVWTALGKVAEAQSDHHAAADPVQRFVELLRTAIASGHAHVAFTDGSNPAHFEAWGWRERSSYSDKRETKEIAPRGDRIGWTDGVALYLDPNAAYRVAQGVAAATGDALAISPRTLTKRLHERGVLASVDETRHKLTVRRCLQGCRRDVLHLKAQTIVDTATVGQTESTTATAA